MLFIIAPALTGFRFYEQTARVN